MSNKCFEYFKGDNFARENGIVLVTCNPGHAIVKVEITARHLNGAGVVHGGLLFTTLVTCEHINFLTTIH